MYFSFSIILGHRLDAKVRKYVQAQSWMDCITKCILHENISSRSVNFRKTGCGENKNCELLKTIDPEEPPGSLKKNESFDHYILLKTDIVSTLSSQKMFVYLKSGNCIRFKI